MRACILFDTRYGNTEIVAKAFERGLRAAGLETVCLNAREVVVESLKDFDLVCIGGPTERHTASKRMKTFLSGLRKVNLAGTYGFAFDTRLAKRFSGSAAEDIERDLKRAGARLVTHSRSAKVVLRRTDTGGASLKEGELKRFEKIGIQVGRALVAWEGKSSSGP